ncbi:hypothetical protein MNBD_UNCLBAC01-1125 [hydrothermal vent metagenome]|uniref:PAS domain-containing protein n=1 Tax=hydrothermal vent metagenome TaxID=652676 RepID=A0A3B1DVB3_9ZZZZ
MSGFFYLKYQTDMESSRQRYIKEKHLEILETANEIERIDVKKNKEFALLGYVIVMIVMIFLFLGLHLMRRNDVIAEKAKFELEEKVKERTFDLERKNVQQKKIEEELRQGKEYTAAVIETANQAFVSIDSNSLVIDWNKHAEVIFGWSKDEIIGRPLEETIIPEKFKEGHQKGMDHFLKTGEGPVLGSAVELEGRRRSGEIFPLEILIWRLEIKGGYHFFAFINDISARKRVEQQLKDKMNEMEKFYDLTMDRETRVIELKEEINSLCEEVGRPKVYNTKDEGVV